jgi:zinc/manganese transport system substrate-binding protein
MTTRRHLIPLALAALTGLSAVPFATMAADAPQRPLQVVASFSILADMVREVAGDVAVVTALVGPDADAHVYEPTPADVKRVAAADLVIVNGLRFEGWMERLVRVSGYKGKLVVATQGITPRKLSGADDPHAWQSLANAKQYVENIRKALVAAVPAQANAINARATAYLQRIEALDQKARADFNAIPEARRRVITSHDAFGYLAQAYGITFLSPQGWTTNAEASAADVAKVIRQIKTQKANALFVENITDPRLIQRIAKEAGVAMGGTLYSDALSLPGTEADSYLKLMAHNIGLLAGALRPMR